MVIDGEIIMQNIIIFVYCKLNVNFWRCSVKVIRFFVRSLSLTYYFLYKADRDLYIKIVHFAVFGRRKQWNSKYVETHPVRVALSWGKIIDVCNGRFTRTYMEIEP